MRLALLLLLLTGLLGFIGWEQAKMRETESLPFRPMPF